MEIKTKFSIGDTIFYMKNNRVKSASIIEISIQVTGVEQYVKYKVEEERSYSYSPIYKKYIKAEDAFSTQEELINNIKI